MKPIHPTRRAFTLLELLIIIGIIALLMALLLPAVQKVRAAADRMRCGSNLRQLGIALHAYHNDQGKFPPARILGPYAQMGVFTNVEHSWATFLLPYLEQDSIYRLYDFSLDWRHPQHAPVREKSLAVHLCPAAERRDLDRFTDIYSWQAATGDYTTIMRIEDFLADFGLIEPAGDLRGVLTSNEQTAIEEIYDGTSNTVMLVECAGRPHLYRMGQSFPEIRVRGGGWADARNAFSIQGASFDGDPGGGPCAMNCTNDREIYSFHAFGANFLFADGSVRFLSQRLTMRVMANLITRNGGEVPVELD